MTDSTKGQRELPGWIVQHLKVYAENPEKGRLWDATAAGGKPNTPCLLLTTTGRKSGQSLTLPLIYGEDQGHYLIVASKGGAPEHPAWYLNLSANSHVGVQVAAHKFQATARTATGAERERLWKKMVEIYPPYADYQKKTSREIPVVVLEKVAG